ncbi:hypothetical protein [Amycolatopsis methanolica]|uniref:Uncharacterized protein n=1 Tax=Amycolatopsis methanolica 239 TaxID=1068978 RepID=A0A076N503_AMYME|nr:hypothetical protein [Amycolatopsis methanolica]AIJ26386.1 hypothetical protein AMETH_6294 [Amycolatopsis methanolica 239]AIJ26445.1 hypothetical protein AMETH_6353 [Amycolatopsis methanolica 239]
MTKQSDQHSLPLWGGSSGPAEHRPLFAVGERVGYHRDASWRGRVVQVAADPDSGRHHFWVVWTVGRPGGPFEYTAAPLYRLGEASPDARRTERQGQYLAAGAHPLTAALGYPVKLHPGAAPAADRAAPGRRCGNCRYRRPGRYPKCLVHDGDRITRGAGTDVRAWWPACTDHELRSRP